MEWRIEDTPEQAAFREEVRTWITEQLPADWVSAVASGDDEAFAAARKSAETGGWNPGRWMRTVGESGYAAPLWPKEHGGLSADTWAPRIVRSEMEHFRLPTVFPNILGVGLAGPTLIEHGTQEQKDRYLRKILTGEEIWCQLFSEPGSGSDLASVTTKAVRDGDEWLVSGQKVWTSVAQLSKFGMLLARSDASKPKHEGLTYFIVEMGAPGVEIRPLRQMTGSSEFNEVYFTDVRIPHENVVGSVGDGWRVARTTLMNERVALSGVALDPVAFIGGTRRDPWASFLDKVPHRSDAVVRQKVAQAYIEQQVKEITSFRAAAARQAGAQPGPEGSIGKVFNATYNQWRSSFVMDANGPGAVAWMPDDREAESRAYTFMRARANSIEGGTSEILRNMIGERVLGLPREPDVDKGVPFNETAKS